MITRDLTSFYGKFSWFRWLSHFGSSIMQRHTRYIREIKQKGNLNSIPLLLMERDIIGVGCRALVMIRKISMQCCDHHNNKAAKSPVSRLKKPNEYGNENNNKAVTWFSNKTSARYCAAPAPMPLCLRSNVVSVYVQRRHVEKIETCQSSYRVVS